MVSLSTVINRYRHTTETDFYASLHRPICHGNQCLVTFRQPVKTGFGQLVAGYEKSPVLTILLLSATHFLFIRLLFSYFMLVS